MLLQMAKQEQAAEEQVQAVVVEEHVAPVVVSITNNSIQLNVFSLNN